MNTYTENHPENYVSRYGRNLMDKDSEPTTTTDDPPFVLGIYVVKFVHFYTYRPIATRTHMPTPITYIVG